MFHHVATTEDIARLERLLLHTLIPKLDKIMADNSKVLADEATILTGLQNLAAKVDALQTTINGSSASTDAAVQAALDDVHTQLAPLVAAAQVPEAAPASTDTPVPAPGA